MKLFILIVLWGLSAGIGAQQLSTTIFPSEDELLEALIQGEIDSYQFNKLQEIFLEGINQQNIHLLSEFPNFLFKTDSLSSQLPDPNLEQLSYLKSDFKIRKETSGKIEYNYYQKISKGEDSRYRIKLDYSFFSGWKLNTRLNREYSGKERFVYRSIQYFSKKTFIKEFIAGSYNRKIGLGSVLGYRGKLLDYSGKFEEESFYYPDYGGSNGVFIKASRNNNNIVLFSSNKRDQNFRLSTAGLSFEKHISKSSISVTGGFNQIKNRDSILAIEDYKTAINYKFVTYNFTNQFEFAIQRGEYKSFALMNEGSISGKNHRINYSFWSYGAEFFDISSGSHSANLRHTLYLESIDFSLSTKRSDQKGMMLKSKYSFSNKFVFSNSIIVGGFNSDTLNLEILSAVIKPLGDKFKLRIEYLNKFNKRNLVGNLSNDNIKHRLKTELKFTSNKYWIRTYVGLQNQTDKENYLLYLLKLKYVYNKNNTYELYSYLSKFNLHNKIIEHWNLYFKNNLELYPNFYLSIKASHSYSRISTDKHKTTISSNMRWGF